MWTKKRKCGLHWTNIVYVFLRAYLKIIVYLVLCILQGREGDRPIKAFLKDYKPYNKANQMKNLVKAKRF